MADRSERLARLLRHDLRSPMAVVLGQCELLQLGVHGELTPRQEAAIESVVRQTERALKLLEEAEALTRPVAPGEDAP